MYKFSNRIGIAITFFILIFTGVLYAQHSPLKDLTLETLLKENKIPDAVNHIENKLKDIESFGPEQQSYYYNKYSQVKLITGDFEDALAWAKKSEAMLKDVTGSKMLGDSYRAISFAFIRTGKLDSALLYAEKLYEFTKRENDLSLRKAALMALGNISLQNKKYQNSLKFYKEALEITQNLGDSINLKIDLYNVGLAYSTLEDYDSSNEILKKAAIRAENEGEKRLLARIYGTMADNYLSLDQFEQQIIFLNKANALARELGDQQLLAMGYANLMETHIRSKDFNAALKLGKDVAALLENKPAIQLSAKVDSMMYVSYKAIGDDKNALKLLELYDRKKESIRSENQKRKLEELTMEFEVEKKNLLIQSQEIQIREERAKSSLYLVIIIGLLLLAALLFYIYIKNAQNRSLFFRKEMEIDFQIEKAKILTEKQPEKIIISANTENISKHIEEDTPVKKSQLLFLDAMEIIEKKKLYLDPDLNQKSLALELGTNRQYLYEALNYKGDDNFRGLINRLRINDAKKIIEASIVNGNKINFSTINERVGFRSYSTYYRAFKGLTGLTPNEYAEEYKNNLVTSGYS
jgi:YesN/AraC family two-component response regulator